MIRVNRKECDIDRPNPTGPPAESLPQIDALRTDIFVPAYRWLAEQGFSCRGVSLAVVEAAVDKARARYSRDGYRYTPARY